MGPQANSDRLRPRRRASQTHFFRYQQAANPLRAEEEDLKKALIASLQDGSKKKKGGITVQDVLNQFNKNQNLNNESKALKQQYATNNNKKFIVSNDIEEKPTSRQKKRKPKTPINKKQVTSTATPTTKAKRCTSIDQQKRVTSNKTISRKKHSNISQSTCTSTNNSSASAATTGPNKTSTKSNYAASKKYAALRKFASNQSRPAATTSPLKNHPGNATHDRGNNGGLQSEYFPKTFKPETEDFLTFLCVRLPPPMFSDFEYSTLASAITAHARGDFFNLLTHNRLKDDEMSNPEEEVANGVAQETPDLIKGLMTSEFAGAFADEESLFDLVDNSVRSNT